MKKRLLIIVGLVIISGVALFLNLGGVVRTIIETAGTRALGTAVHVSGLDISLADKAAKMRSLRVANPRGFSSGDLLKTDSISVAVEDVGQNVVVLKEIVVDGMVVKYELGPAGTNFDALRRHLASSAAEEKPTADKGADTKVIIRRFLIRRAQLVSSVGIAQAPISLPDIVLTDIGAPGAPATPVQVATQVMNKVLTVSSAALMQHGLADSINKAMGGAKRKLKGLFSK